MVSWIFQKVRKTLQMKPLLLWGIRLLAGLLVWLAAIGFWTVPAVAFALNLVLSGSRRKGEKRSQTSGKVP